MVITLDKVAKEAALRAGDRQLERLKEIKGYTKDLVIELTMLLRSGSVYETAALPVTDGAASLPDNCVAVLRVYDSAGVVYEEVDNAEYRTREAGESTIPTIGVFENVPNWTMRLLNFNTSNTNPTLSIDYLVSNPDPAIMPDYYFYLLVAGTEAKYHARRSTPERYQVAMQEYKRLKDQFLENKVYNVGRVIRMKSLREIDNLNPNNSSFIRTRNDYISPGGYY